MGSTMQALPVGVPDLDHGPGHGHGDGGGESDTTPPMTIAVDSEPTSIAGDDGDEAGEAEEDDEDGQGSHEWQAHDRDSALGSSISSRRSITSSIMRFREENGRTYHAYRAGKYIGPNDDPEQERLELQHAICQLTFNNQLYHCPAIRSGEHRVSRVLDVGTGTGCWAIDFAEEHPEAHVIGVDLSPIQPNFVPPNVEFRVDDIEDTWDFSARFDFIFSRFMAASFADGPRFFQQCYENLNPGGWLEVIDILPPTSDDGTLSPDTALARWSTMLQEGTKRIGRGWDTVPLYRYQMEAAGFVGVTRPREYKWPQNRWPKERRYKEIGAWTLENIDVGMEAMSNAVFTRVLGWSKADLDLLIADVRRDIRDTRIHAYWPIVVLYAQKPPS